MILYTFKEGGKFWVKRFNGPAVAVSEARYARLATLLDNRTIDRVRREWALVELAQQAQALNMGY